MSSPGERGAVTTPAEALARTHAWFEVNSGWAPPDPDTLAEWQADGVCRCPDECLVAPTSWCEHGLASWALVHDELESFDRAGVSMRAVTRAADPPPPDERTGHDLPGDEPSPGQEFIGDAIHQTFTAVGQAHPRVEELAVVAHVGAHDVPPPHDLSLVDRFDETIDRAFDRLRGTEPADRIFYAITELGDFGLIWLLIGASRAAVSERQLPNAVRVGAVLSLESVLVNGIIKSLFKRERPVVEVERPYKLRVPLTTSFPSGHSSSAAVAAILLSQHSRAKPLWWVLAGLVASSRVYVRIHHASDIVGGLAVGLVIGTVAKKAWPLDKGPIGTRRLRRRVAARR